MRNSKNLAIGLFVIMLTVIALFTIVLNFFEPIMQHMETPEKINHNSVEKIPLYYDLDDPDKIYTRDGEKFVEVSLNG